MERIPFLDYLAAEIAAGRFREDYDNYPMGWRAVSPNWGHHSCAVPRPNDEWSLFVKKRWIRRPLIELWRGERSLESELTEAQREQAVEIWETFLHVKAEKAEALQRQYDEERKRLLWWP
jgi:hypothetical protein